MGSWVKTLLSDAFYWTDNDFVVQTRSMYGGAPRATAPGAAVASASFLLDRGGKVSHFNYFANDRSVAAIAGALSDDAPADFAAIGPLSWAGARRERHARRAHAGRPGGGRPGRQCSSFPASSAPTSRSTASASGSAFVSSTAWAAWPGIRRRRRTSRPTGRSTASTASWSPALAATHEVIAFAFDWRRPIEDEARRLADAVDAALAVRAAQRQPGAHRRPLDGRPARTDHGARAARDVAAPARARRRVACSCSARRTAARGRRCRRCRATTLSATRSRRSARCSTTPARARRWRACPASCSCRPRCSIPRSASTAPRAGKSSPTTTWRSIARAQHLASSKACSGRSTSGACRRRRCSTRRCALRQRLDAQAARSAATRRRCCSSSATPRFTPCRLHVRRCRPRVPRCARRRRWPGALAVRAAARRSHLEARRHARRPAEHASTAFPAYPRAARQRRHAAARSARRGQHLASTSALGAAASRGAAGAGTAAAAAAASCAAARRAACSAARRPRAPPTSSAVVARPAASIGATRPDAARLGAQRRPQVRAPAADASATTARCGLTGTEAMVDRLVAGSMSKSLVGGSLSRRRPARTRSSATSAGPRQRAGDGAAAGGHRRRARRGRQAALAVDLSCTVRQAVLAYAQRLAEQAQRRAGRVRDRGDAARQRRHRHQRRQRGAG